jgi:hypothetical protein
MAHNPAHLSIEDDLGYQYLEARREAARNLAPKHANSSKAALALRIEIERFVQIYGPHCCALLTLLFAIPQGAHMTPKEARLVFKKAARRFFPPPVQGLHRDPRFPSFRRRPSPPRRGPPCRHP